MSESTARLALPLLAAGQAQKEVSHNEALTRIDLAAQASVIAAGTETPPDEPEPGQCWVLGESPEGAWAGQAFAVAGWTEGGWRFLLPREGMRVWIEESEAFALFTGGYWVTGRAHGRLFVEGVQVVGPQAAAIAAPSGGGTIDAEARMAISAILTRLQAHGLIGAP
jgi:hypothetical protein